MDITTVGDSREFSHDELCRLLSYLEGEVQARDIVIATYKSEKAKQLLFEARYGRLTEYDPFSALQRDSKLQNEDVKDGSGVGQMYESQLKQLERLISAQKKYHARYKQVLAATERRHARILRELDEQKKRSENSVAQGDEVFAFLEDERSRLRQQLQYEKKENEKMHDSLGKMEKKMQDEKERHKAIVLFLINERKQMLVKMHEMRVHCDRQEGLLISEIRKEVNSLREERDQLKSSLNSAQEEISALKEVNQNNTQRYSEIEVRAYGDGSLILSNKNASASLPPLKPSGATLPPSSTSESRLGSRLRLSSSSSFPSGERNMPSKVPLPSVSFHRPTTSSAAISASSTSSLAKRTASNTGKVDNRANNLHKLPKSGDNAERSKATRLLRVAKKEQTPFVMEPEIEQLGAAIDSLSTKATRRSSSLPRNGAAVSGGRKETNGIKTSKSEKRSGLFRAFGVSSKNDRNL
uniref:CortBP2 domain-containing protein n=1 Tax=Syphacia muris TaxID=451379 RepID=A0A0N5AX86_9BILA